MTDPTAASDATDPEVTDPDAPDPDAPDPDAPDREFGRWLFAQRCDFMAGVQTMDQLPEFDRPEVAFAGRSNVGKSSLVNGLTGRKTLARVSHTPGRTRQLNFFDLGGRLMLVDLPGYGYAKAPKTEIKRWTQVTGDYLRGRPTLRRVCLLIDARHGPKDTDLGVMRDLDKAAVSYQIVLTKVDKTRAPELAKVVAGIEALRKHHVALHPQVIASSAHKETGLAELRAEIAALASPGASG